MSQKLNNLVSRTKRLATKFSVGIISLTTLGGASFTTAAGVVAHADEQVTVQQGDTLSKIASDHNTTAAQIASDNGKDVNATLHVGDVFNIKSTPDTYTVKDGDTLSQIAHDNGVDLNTLFQLNGKSETNTLIHVGDVLKLRDVAVKTAAPAQSTQTSQAATTTQVSASAQQVQSAQPTAQVATTTQAAGATNASLQKLIQRESGGNVNARNGQYYGLGQLSPQARATYGGNSTDYNDQVNAMLGYISARYGTPENALAHSDAYGWY